MTLVDLDEIDAVILAELASARRREETAEQRAQLRAWDELAARACDPAHVDPATAQVVHLMIRTADAATCMVTEGYFSFCDIVEAVTRAAVKAGLPCDLARSAAARGARAAAP